mmetsp:Transcript_24064/g.39547  ORF Transcript_24064/g.39547 Transcript_24064/m.39547 type:complete len:109 (-) Transcript_24064:1039-1365(-)
MPFSTEKLSVGRPEIFQARTFIGSPKVWLSEKSEEQGISFCLQSSAHSATQCLRKPAVKAPKYATIADANNTSPVKFVYVPVSSSATCIHLELSPPSPPMSFSARSSF